MKKGVLPKDAKERAQVLFSIATQAQDRFQVYIQGCKDTLNLNGDWNLNTRTWEFEPITKEEK